MTWGKAAGLDLMNIPWKKDELWLYRDIVTVGDERVFLIKGIAEGLTEER